ncbi:type 1 fimbrial protein, partial [Citrobacter braakii]|nr:type 1 fimbrial protein [Citrobacter braakii]
MMMKTALTSSVLVALFAANAGAANVTTPGAGSKATATVNFTGDIVASTCVVNTATTDKDITLPQVTNQLFGSAG